MKHLQMQSMTKRGLRLFYSEDEGESSDEGNKMALATVRLFLNLPLNQIVIMFVRVSMLTL